MAAIIASRSKQCASHVRSSLFLLSRRQTHDKPTTIPSWYRMPETFDHVVYPPGSRTLPEFPKVPVYLDADESEEITMYRKISRAEKKRAPLKHTKRLIEIRGPELFHNQLIHKQYGLAAVTGGMLERKHLETIRQALNHQIDKVELYKDAFAVWRIPSPWLPRYLKSQGVKMGGGKSKPHHYVTPVRSGRIIVEFGGKIVYDQARKLLDELAHKMPFSARFVSYDEMLKENEAEEILKRMNKNKYSWAFCMKWDMHGCSKYLKEYDYQWGGDYR